MNDVVERADALIGGRRRRAFVAAGKTSPKTGQPLPTLTPDDDDIPVLTEVLSPEAAVVEASPDRFNEMQVTVLASDIAHAIGEQMSAELPALLEAALLSASEELRAGITSTMESALRDFIARRKQLSLPLDEPGKKR